MKKNEKSYPILLASIALLLFLIIFSSTASSAATDAYNTNGSNTAKIHGAVYTLDTLESLDNAVININSNPPQTIVAKNGMYSVELVPGNYTITAKYYQNNVLTYAIEETIEIKDRENYVLDLLLPPDEKNTTNNQPVITIQKKTGGLIEINQTNNDFQSVHTSDYFNIIICALLTITAAFIGSLLGMKR